MMITSPTFAGCVVRPGIRPDSHARCELRTEDGDQGSRCDRLAFDEAGTIKDGARRYTRRLGCKGTRSYQQQNREMKASHLSLAFSISAHSSPTTRGS